MNHRGLLSALILILSSTLLAQQPRFQLGPWKQTELNGSATLQGIYRSQETILKSGFTENPDFQHYDAIIKLHSGSYLWHPNFIKLNLDVQYQPAVRNEQFLVQPDRTEGRTAEQIRLHTIFYDQRPLSFNLLYNLTHMYLNREFAASSEAFNRDFKIGLSLQNQLAPFSLHYSNSDWDQKELASDRRFRNKRDNVTLMVNKAFSRRDDHRLQYTYDAYNRQYQTNLHIKNQVHNLRLQNRYQFGKDMADTWNSFIVYRRQAGAQSFNRLQLDQRIGYQLPWHLKWKGFYNYTSYQPLQMDNRQHNLRSELQHQLFRSLFSRLSYEHIRYSQKTYDEITHQGLLDIRYSKLIPTGILDITWNYRLRNDQRDSQPGLFAVSREVIELNDGAVVLLANPDVQVGSVRIYDESGTIYYQQDRDYILIQRGSYLEIQRLAGGLIADGETLYIDYQAAQNRNFDFTTHTQNIHVGLSLWQRLVHAYYRYQNQHYASVKKADDKILKHIDQQVAGLQLQKNLFTAGAEYTVFNSNIVPYRSSRVFIKLNHHLLNKLQALLTSSWRTYRLTDVDELQQFGELAGRLSYQIGYYTQLALDGGYRLQNGQGIDLHLANVRAEFSTRFRSVYFHLGLELYRRNFAGEKINYNGGFVKVERKF